MNSISPWPCAGLVVWLGRAAAPSLLSSDLVIYFKQVKNFPLLKLLISSIMVFLVAQKVSHNY